jgi:predicted ATPase
MTVVEGVAAMTAAGAITGSNTKSEIALRIEQAMAQAVQDCYTAGVTDPDKVRAAMLAARDKLLG